MEEEKGVYFNVEYGQVRDQFSTTNTTELQDLVGNHKLIAFDEVQSIKAAGLVASRSIRVLSPRIEPPVRDEVEQFRIGVGLGGSGQREAGE